MKKIEQSAALHVMDILYAHAKLKGWQSFNGNLQTALLNIINFNIEFGENDYREIISRYKGGYWLGVSLNGHHQGESFYAAGTLALSNSFCVSYENHTGRVPFLVKANRVYQGFEFKYKNLWWTVTGWNRENNEIKCVGYTNRMNEGKRTLLQFNRELWLKERKFITTK